MTSVTDNAPQTVTWSVIAAALTPPRNYWLITINPDGSPHVSPVWGGVYSGHFHFYTSRTTVKARNLARDGRAVIHLESAEHVVIVHGSATDLEGPNLSSEVMAVLDGKYDQPGDGDYLPSNSESYDVLYRFRPRKALLWQLADFEASQARWTSTESR